MSDTELGAYLRTCREGVTPEDVGLPAGPRRRTPGLRRAELATLAGVSVDYLTRLEQGRDRRPSPQVLAALADALQLDPAERIVLRNLAKVANGEAFCPSMETPPARTVRPTVQALVERLEPTPAVLLNRLGDVLLHTDGYRALAEPTGLLDGEPNLGRYLFTDPRALDTYPDWDTVADRYVAALRVDSGPQDPHVLALAEELSVLAGAAFTDRWDAPVSAPERTGIEHVAHPDAGELRLAFETLDLPDAGYQRLLVYLPADDASTGALDRLTGRRPGALHAVAG